MISIWFSFIVGRANSEILLRLLFNWHLCRLHLATRTAHADGLLRREEEGFVQGILLLQATTGLIQAAWRILLAQLLPRRVGL